MEEVPILTKYLIEWVVTNPENTQNKFSGNVYLYQLQPDLSVNSKNISVNSEIPENLKRLVAIESFNLLTKDERKEKWGRFGENNPNWKNGSSIKYCKCGKKIRPSEWC